MYIDSLGVKYFKSVAVWLERVYRRGWLDSKEVYCGIMEVIYHL